MKEKGNIHRLHLKENPQGRQKKKERELKTKIRTVWSPGWIRSQAERRGAKAGKCCLSTSPQLSQVASSVIFHFLFVFSSWWPGAGACACTRLYVFWALDKQLQETTVKFPPLGQPGWEKSWFVPWLEKPESTAGGCICITTMTGAPAHVPAVVGAWCSAGWPQCLHPKSCQIVSQQLLGFCNQELAQAAVAAHP